MNKRMIRLALSFLLFLLLIALDQWTKSLATASLQEQPFVILKGVFELQYSENYGAAFGLLEGKYLLFVAVSLLVFAAVLYLLWTLPESKSGGKSDRPDNAGLRRGFPLLQADRFPDLQCGGLLCDGSHRTSVRTAVFGLLQR